MINRILICKIGFIALVSFLTTIHLVAADRYSVATGNWNATTTWSATSGGVQVQVYLLPEIMFLLKVDTP